MAYGLLAVHYRVGCAQGGNVFSSHRKHFMHDKPPKIPRVLLVGVLLLATTTVGLLVHTIRVSCCQTPRQLPDTMLGYPETGFQLPVPTAQPVVPAQAIVPPPAVFELAYEDIVHPDEDLLQPQAPDLPSSSLPSPPAAGAPNATIPPTPPTPQLVEPPTSPTEVTADPPVVSSPADSTTSDPPSITPVQPDSAPLGRGYDINAGPAPDEDLLLQPFESSPDDTSAAPQPPEAATEPAELPAPTQSPIEVLPADPRPQPGAPVTPPSPPQSDTGLVPYAPHSTGGPPAAVNSGSGDPHAAVFAETLFPSAKECRACHEKIYEEWASSSHAYASVSPMFQKFEHAINVLAKGTLGYFCMRCHAPIATELGLPREAPIYTTIPAGVEGVTCIACHRVIEEYGKVNGERRIEPGTKHDPVVGAGFGEGLATVLAKKDYYKVKTSPHDKGAGLDIHNRVIHFEQISSSHFCVSCHQVAVYPGIKLEVVWEQYRASPAHKQGIQCQECHMGREPGMAYGYDTGPVAVVNGKEISPQRKHSNHLFYGPGYSIAHPGTFPFNQDATQWKIAEWLQFDYRAGWGTAAFEDMVADNKIRVAFPAVWQDADDRRDARDVVAANLQKLETKRALRRRLMENSSCVQGPVFKCQPKTGRPLHFHYEVHNKNNGHNMPSGSLGAQPQIWLNVALTGPQGQHLWESGYVDANGDLADLHSLEVAAGRIRRDLQLFNLQTKFLITHVKGTDREMYLPINTDFDQLPFIRPSGFPITVMNHPPFIRMEGHSLAPLGSRHAKYKVPASVITMPGRYRLSARMRSRAEPIYFMRFCRATPEMERNMNEWMLDFHEDHYDFFVAP